jgi:hypothetical protein
MLAAARQLAVAALAAWALAGLGVETARTVREGAAGGDGGPGEDGPVILWRMGTAPPARLAAFAEAVGAAAPPGSVVVWVTGDGEGDPEFFQSLWAAYLLPRHRVIPLAHPRSRLDGEYLAAYRTVIDHPRAAAPRWLPGGALYRILPPP